MKRTTVDRHYIYLRDQGICRFCGKELRYGRMSLDHYFPKSEGGPDEVFNLFCSCKRCNVMKKSRIPHDWESVWIQTFERAVRDRKLLLAVPGLNWSRLQAEAVNILSAELSGECVVFSNKWKRFHVKQCRIIKITEYSNSNLEDSHGAISHPYDLAAEAEFQ